MNRKILTLTLLSSLIFLTSSSEVYASGKSQSYFDGVDWILNATPDELYNMGFMKLFDSSGKPVKTLMTNFCSTKSRMIYIHPKKPKDWMKGCIAASMYLRLDRSYGAYTIIKPR